jgi:chromosome segregation ATPase
VTEDPYVTELKDEIVELRNQLVAKDKEIERLSSVKEPVDMDDFYELTLTAKNDKIVLLARQLKIVQERLMNVEYTCLTQESKLRASERSLIMAERREKVWQAKCHDLETELGAKNDDLNDALYRLDDALYRLGEAEDAYTRVLKANKELQQQREISRQDIVSRNNWLAQKDVEIADLKDELSRCPDYYNDYHLEKHKHDELKKELETKTRELEKQLAIAKLIGGYFGIEINEKWDGSRSRHSCLCKACRYARCKELNYMLSTFDKPLKEIETKSEPVKEPVAEPVPVVKKTWEPRRSARLSNKPRVNYSEYDDEE